MRKLQLIKYIIFAREEYGMRIREEGSVVVVCKPLH